MNAIASLKVKLNYTLNAIQGISLVLDFLGYEG